MKNVVNKGVAGVASGVDGAPVNVRTASRYGCSMLSAASGVCAGEDSSRSEILRIPGSAPNEWMYGLVRIYTHISLLVPT